MEGPNKSKENKGDYVDWERLRLTSEYSKYMATHLRMKLEDLLLPAGLQEKRAAIYDDFNIDDFNSIEEYITETQKVDPATEEQLKTLYEIHNLETIENIREYCKLKKISLDIDQYIQEAEKTYIKNQKAAAEMKRKLYDDPEFRRSIKFFTGEEPDEEEPQ